MSGENDGFNATEKDILDTYANKPADTGQGVNDGTQEGQDDGSQEGAQGQGQEGAKEGQDGDKKVGADGKPVDPAKAGKDGQQPVDKNKKPVASTRDPAQPQPGAERRLVERFQRDNANLQTQLRNVSAELQGYKEANQMFSTMELPQVQRIASLSAMYQKDPLAAITEILVGAKQDGVDLSKLELNTIDTKAITALIKQHIGDKIDPIVNQQNQTRADAQAVADATVELDDFIADNPRAEMHLDAISRIMAKDPTQSLRSAWLEVRAWAADNGVDLSVPPGQATNSQGSQQRTTVKPLPNGGGRQIVGNGGSPGNAQPRQPNAPKAAGTSLDAIILESMHEAGMQYRK